MFIEASVGQSALIDQRIISTLLMNNWINSITMFYSDEISSLWRKEHWSYLTWSELWTLIIWICVLSAVTETKVFKVNPTERNESICECEDHQPTLSCQNNMSRVHTWFFVCMYLCCIYSEGYMMCLCESVWSSRLNTCCRKCWYKNCWRQTLRLITASTVCHMSCCIHGNHCSPHVNPVDSAVSQC